jgi:hypothetical protein
MCNSILVAISPPPHVHTPVDDHTKTVDQRLFSLSTLISGLVAVRLTVTKRAQKNQVPRWCASGSSQVRNDPSTFYFCSCCHLSPTPCMHKPLIGCPNLRVYLVLFVAFKLHSNSYYHESCTIKQLKAATSCTKHLYSCSIIVSVKSCVTLECACSVAAYSNRCKT